MQSLNGRFSPLKKNNLVPYHRFVSQQLQLRLITRLRESASQFRTGTAPRQILFIHIPKTAGSTACTYIEACIGSYKSGRSARISELDLNNLPSEERYAAAHQARFTCGHFSWSLMENIAHQSDPYRFTVLRAPYERMRSYYFYMRHHPINKIPRGLLSVYARAEQEPAMFFSGDTDQRFHHVLNNYMTRALGGESLRVPQSALEWSEVLDRAKANLERLDHVCFTHSFRSDFIEVLDAVDLPLVEPIRRQNVTAELVESDEEKALMERPFDAATDEAIEPLIEYDREVYDHARKLKDQKGRFHQAA